MRNFGILLLSHGKYAKSALESVEMIGGVQEGVQALELDIYKSADQLKNELITAVEKLQESYEQILVLTDLYGGTPFNVTLSSLIESSPFIAYAGFNLPILLSVCLSGELDEQGIHDLVQTTHQESLCCMNHLALDIDSDETDL